MLRNYLLVSIRNLKRHFTYSFVNIFGLMIGLACTMVIGMWVKQEFSYDQHFQNADRIYRVGVDFYSIGKMARGPEILKTKLSEYSGVGKTTNLSQIGDVTLLVGDKEILQEQVFVTDKDFFQLFSYEFLTGEASSVLQRPDGAVITEQAAIHLFGSTDVLNRTIQLKDDPQVYAIEGVVSSEKMTHIPAEVWLSDGGRTLETSWTSASPNSYVLVTSEDPTEVLNTILDDILEKEIQPKIAAGETFEDFKQSGLYQFFPIPIIDIHLYSDFIFEMSPIGNAMTTKVFAGIALLILFLASINFINISTARSTVRAKEVGIRKSLGTSRSQLFLQFILESILIVFVAAGLAMLLGTLFLAGFEKVTGLKLLDSLFINPVDFVVVFVAAIVLGFIAGIYPALYITRYQTVKVLKGDVGVNEKGAVRNGLVLFQFVISISLLVVSMFVFSQLKFIQNKDLGFDSENVLVVPNFSEVSQHGNFIKQELLKNASISVVSINQRVPAENGSFVSKIAKDGEDQERWFQQFSGDEDMFECMGFRLLSGRNFSGEIATDTSAVILNETAVKELGFENPIGQTLNGGYYKIIGVVSDFNYETLKNQITPVILGFSKEKGRNLAIKFSGSNPQLVIDHLNTIWDGLGAKKKADYYFLNENFEQIVAKERVLSKAILIFTSLAMFISCLGLYGLSVFTAERKTKEIGIRRVLGASVLNITKLLSGNFSKPIVIAFCLSIPISYLAVDNWLANYAYRVEIEPTLFLIAGLIALIIGIVTISWQSIRSALKNPVDSLRAE
ncbi:MAG: ABC transporter permease [Cyclobacteriaceae bacterium]